MRALKIIPLLLLPGMLTAQERMGISNSNYSGTTGMYLNPSSMVDQKVWLDIRLTGAGLMAQNNYINLPSTTIYPYLNGRADQVNDRYTPTKKHGSVVGNVAGPGFTLNIGKHAFGLSTSIRSYTNANRIPSHFAKLAFEEFAYTDLQNQNHTVKNASVDHMTWAELGLSYGTILKQNGRHMLNGGATLKVLYGISSGNLTVKNADYLVNSSNDLELYDFDGVARFIQPKFGSGKGMGVDIGITYKKMKQDVSSYVPHSTTSNCEQVDYKYKLGVSLLDVGYIKYKGTNVKSVYENGNGTTNTSFDIDNPFQPFDDVTDEQNIERLDKYFQHLPMALSVQFDYHLTKYVYLNATVIQNVIAPRLSGVVRPNVISFTPRFETKFFEISMPINLYEHRYPSVGLAARFWGVTIGSDIFLPYVVKHNIYKSDIYVNVSIPFYKSPQCKSRNKTRSKGDRGGYGKAVKCPSFN